MNDPAPAQRAHIYLLAAIATLLYLPSLFGAFVYDDHYLLEQNTTLQSPAGFVSAFKDDYYGQANPQYALGYYRPLSLLTHWLDWQIFGAHPWGHHLTNLILHICCTVVLYLLILALFGESQLALLAATVFAAHPAHAGTVCFISGRVDALAALFSLLSLLFFCRRRSLSAPSYFAALLSKEMSVTVPLLAFWKEKEQGWKKAVVAMVPFVVALVAVLILRFGILGAPRITLLSQMGGGAPWQTVPAYLRFLVLPPFQLYMEPAPAQMPWVWNLAATFIFAAGAWLLKDRRVAGWSLVWLITLLPVAGIVQLETSLDERFLYLPSVSVCLLAAAWILQYLKKRNADGEVSEKHVIVSVLVIAGVLAPALLLRQAYWHNDLSLWNSAMATAPQSSRIRLRLGVALLEAGDATEAERQFREGLALKQEGGMYTAALYTHLATAEQMQGRDSEAEMLYKKALGLAPNYYTAHFNLGLYYKKHQQIEEARKQFEAALRANPRSQAARQQLEEISRKAR